MPVEQDLIPIPSVLFNYLQREEKGSGLGRSVNELFFELLVNGLPGRKLKHWALSDGFGYHKGDKAIRFLRVGNQMRNAFHAVQRRLREESSVCASISEITFANAVFAMAVLDGEPMDHADDFVRYASSKGFIQYMVPVRLIVDKERYVIRFGKATEVSDSDTDSSESEDVTNDTGAGL